MFVNIINNPKLLGGNRGTLTAAGQLLKHGRDFALAIVVNTKGSTYRKPGALALYAGDNIFESVISGGCLEANWHKVAAQVITSNEPQSLELDTQGDDDLIFGSGSGCRGSMRVLVIPISAQHSHPLYSAIVDAHEQHKTLRLAVFVDHLHCAQGIAWFGNETRRFTDHVIQLQSLQHAPSGEHIVAMEDGSKAAAAVFDIHPAPSVLLIGASVETPYLIRIAHMLGWQLTVVDHRPTQLEKNASGADTSIHSRPASALDQLQHQTFDAAIIMSHNATIDLDALKALSSRTERYVGLLGPPARRDELLSQLDDTQRSSLLPRLHAPLGLRLGGDGPESLALSIAAELQRFFHNV